MFYQRVEHRVGCNRCRKSHPHWYATADEAEENAGADGWEINVVRGGGDNRHYCPACQEKMAAEDDARHDAEAGKTVAR